MSHVVEINRLEHLEDIRLIWNLLAPQTPGASLFHTLDWLQVYWTHFGSDQRLRVLLAMSKYEPIGILPLVVRREKTPVGTVRVLTYPLRDDGSFFGPVGANPTATLTLGFQHIWATPRDWDLLDIRWVNRDGHDRLRTKWALEHAGYAAHESLWTSTSMIDMTDGWPRYWNSRPGGMRRTMQRDEKRLRECGTVDYIRYRPAGLLSGDDHSRWDLYDTCVKIAGDGWHGQPARGASLSDGKVAEYFRDAHAVAVKLGMVDINLLTVAGQAVAFSYNYISDGHLIGVRHGCRRDFSQYGAGDLLFLNMLRDSFRRGDRSLDLRSGSLESKHCWATHVAHSHRYTHYPVLAPRMQLLRFTQWAKSGRTVPKTRPRKAPSNSQHTLPQSPGARPSIPIGSDACGDGS